MPRFTRIQLFTGLAVLAVIALLIASALTRSPVVSLVFLIVAATSALAVIAVSFLRLRRADAQLKEQLASKAALADETRHQADELAYLLSIASSLSATLSTEDALALICPTAVRLLDATGAALFLLDTGRAELSLAYAEGLSRAFTQDCSVIPLADPGASTLIITPQPQLASDLSAGTHLMPAGWDKLMQAEGLLAYVSIGLHARGEPLGVLICFFTEPPKLKAWTTEVLRAFGSQAALTVANTRLYERTEEALARRMRRLDALASISRELSAKLDLQALCLAIITRAVDATHASFGRLGLLDTASRQLQFVARYGLLPAETEEESRVGWPIEQAIAGRVLQHGAPEVVDDVHRASGRAKGDEDDLPHIRSQLAVPVVREERRSGVILLESDQPHAFNEEDRELVAQIAVQAAIALDNAWLYEELSRRVGEQAILYHAALALTSTLDRRTIYATVAQKLAEVVGADESAIYDYDASTGRAKPVYQWAAGEHRPRPLHRVYSREDFPTLARLLSDRAPHALRVDDAQAEPQVAEPLKADGFGAMLALPLASSDEIVGLVELYSRAPRDFDEAAIRLAQTLAHQATIAIENARLFHRVTEGRDRLVAVLNSTREGVLVVDASGLVSLVNPRLEEFWGISAERLLRQDLPALTKVPGLGIAEKLGFQPDEILEMLQTLRAGLALSIPKAQFQIGGPKPRFLERSGAPVLDQYGKAIGWVITLRDVTDEREVQEVREALSGMIVHDLRSPLTAILASSTLARDQLPPQAKTPIVTQALEVATRSTKKLIGLVSTLLDIARMESGEISLQRTTVGLDALVDEVVDEMMPLATESGLILLNEVPALLPQLLVDRDKVSRIFTNLIDNALKFTPPGGRIWVRGGLASSSLAPDGADMMLCEVADTGPGIPDDYRDRVFERFVQVQGRLGRRQGTGLGLAFCKLVVEAHGGKIWAENRREGGSTFYFTLPIGGGSPHYYAPQQVRTPQSRPQTGSGTRAKTS
jgi:signal transduction histidine kinase